MEKKIGFFLPRIHPMTSSLAALFITHCSNLSFCLLLLICLYLLTILFSHFCFVRRQLYSSFIVFVRALSVFSVNFSCFNVSI